MKSKLKSLRRDPRPLAKLALVILSISFGFFPGGGCSNEEPYEDKKATRVVRIKTPPLKRDLPLERAADKSEEKVSLKNAGAPSDGQKDAGRPQEKPSKPENVKPGEAGDSKKKSDLKITEPPSAVKRKVSPPRKEQSEPAEAAGAGAGFYKVQKGDSLYRIAGRKEVYNDPMRWPSLFRLNMDKLDQMKVGEGFQHKELPEGLELRFTPPSEAAENLDKLGPKPWVVNVMSVENPGRIVPAATALMKKGYRVYLTKARIKGKDWIRLRVGFFKDSAEAGAVRKEIMPLVKDAWLAKIGNRELEKFGGF